MAPQPCPIPHNFFAPVLYFCFILPSGGSLGTLSDMSVFVLQGEAPGQPLSLDQAVALSGLHSRNPSTNIPLGEQQPHVGVGLSDHPHCLPSLCACSLQGLAPIRPASQQIHASTTFPSTFLSVSPSHPGPLSTFCAFTLPLLCHCMQVSTLSAAKRSFWGWKAHSLVTRASPLPPFHTPPTWPTAASSSRACWAQRAPLTLDCPQTSSPCRPPRAPHTCQALP